MADDSIYISVDKQSESEIVEKKSRFICNMKHIESEDEALEFIRKIRKKYYDARHNVYAYIVGDGRIKKCSDDGEPSKTAGLPIMQMLESERVTDVVCVVTRYFGGTLLGTGGLVRANTLSAKTGLAASGLHTMKLCDVYFITVPYSQLATLEYIIKNHLAVVEDKAFSADVTVRVHIATESAAAFIAEIGEKFGSAAKTEFCERTYR